MNGVRVIFVLPSRGSNGGANSIVQECAGLVRLGCQVGLAINTANLAQFHTNYPDLQAQGVSVGGYANPRELAELMAGFNIVVATVYISVRDIRDAISASGLPIKMAYYVQDYEPLFEAVDTPGWKRAFQSYALVSGPLFAKTSWLQNMVYQNHGISVAKVAPSLDHEAFYPDVARTPEKLTIGAMLRPHTPRRAPHRTLRIMNRLSRELGSEVNFKVFGCSPEHIHAYGLELPENCESLGILKRTDVPPLMRSLDMFLDLSDYQAFGRTGLESMACGCVPLVPLLGGTSEYARHRDNAFVVDTRADDEICAAAIEYVGMKARQQQDMRIRGLETASEFTVHKAALSEYRLFSNLLAA